MDIIEKAGIMTSESFFKFNDLIATSKAAVPLLTAVPYFLLLYLAKSFSNNFTNLPSEEIQLVEIHSLIYFFLIYVILGYLQE